MNVNLLTIDSNLLGKAGTSPFPSTPDLYTERTKFAPTLEKEKLNYYTYKETTPDNVIDSKTEGKQFVPPLDNTKLQVNEHEKPATNKIKEKIRNHKKLANISQQELTQSIDKKTKSENSSKTDNKTESKEQKTLSDYIKQQNISSNVIQSRLSERSLVEVQIKADAATQIERKSSLRLAQIVANRHYNKSQSVTGHAVKSAEIKLLHTTEKGQLGIKTVLPAKSQGQNGLKAVSLNNLKITPDGPIRINAENNTQKAPAPTKAVAGAKLAADKENTTELAPEVSDKTGKLKNAKPSTGNINSTTVQAKTSQMQNLSNDFEPEKPGLTATTESKTKVTQNNSNLSNSGGKEFMPAGNNLPGNQSFQRLNAAAVHVTTGQTKDQSNLTSGKSSSEGFEQLVSQNNVQTIITEQSSVSGKTAAKNLPGSSSSSEASADIGKQILESVQKSISQQGTDRQITVRLNPPELGKVLIRFQQQNAELTGLMEVNKAQTRFEIEQALPQIIRNLADFGIQVKRLDVTLSNEQQSGQGANGNQSLTSGGSQQQYSSNPGTSGNDMDVHQSDEWLASNSNFEDLSDLQGTLVSDSSINLLI